MRSTIPLMKQTTVYLPEELKHDLKMTAKRENRTEASIIREALEEIEDDISEARRNAGVANAIQRSSTLPTEDHLWQVDHAWEVMGETVPELNALIETRVPALNSQLYAAGVRPDAGDAVELPGR